jgi:hypothetical protein
VLARAERFLAAWQVEHEAEVMDLLLDHDATGDELDAALAHERELFAEGLRAVRALVFEMARPDRLH